MGKRVQHWNAYEGSCVKLIICIDIGTTNSGASYAFLEPGKPPKVFDTGAFPKSTRGSYKAPSVVAYDTNGKCVAVGSEVDEDMHNAEAEQALFVAKWWKLALTTSNIPTCVDLSTHIELPAGVSAEDCLIRYLAWMWQCVKTDIRSRYTQGDDLLRLTEASMELILTHPNTWDGRAQKAMRSAAVQAGVVSAHSAEQAVRFLTEAEASLTYAVLHSTMQSWVQPGKSLVIADLGGGTCDFSTYDIVQTQPLLQIRESAIARCVVGGATTVQKRAQQLLRQRLQHTLWESEIDWLAGKLWEIIAKLYPRSDGGVFLKVGSKTQTDESRNIICGKLYFTSAEITALFEPSLCSITDALRAALAASGSSDQKVVLVGGFAENEFLRHRIKEEMGSDVSLVKADNLLAKAVANGGCSWGIQSVVSMRMSAVSYGVRCAVPYLPASPEHRAREGQAIVHSDGIKRVANGYWEILPAVSFENTRFA
ncbi:hypothetical protein OC844_005838 [Tilletia horrida]|nr:hypothetical protein OC844_005838 [Tilletia horrida]